MSVPQGTTMTLMKVMSIITKCICMHVLYSEIQCYLLKLGCLSVRKGHWFICLSVRKVHWINCKAMVFLLSPALKLVASFCDGLDLCCLSSPSAQLREESEAVVKISLKL